MIYVKRFTLISSNDVISEELIFIRTDEESAVRLNRWETSCYNELIGDMAIKNFDHLSNHHSSKLACNEMKDTMIITTGLFIIKQFA